MYKYSELKLDLERPFEMCLFMRIHPSIHPYKAVEKQHIQAAILKHLELRTIRRSPVKIRNT